MRFNVNLDPLIGSALRKEYRSHKGDTCGTVFQETAAFSLGPLYYSLAPGVTNVGNEPYENLTKFPNKEFSVQELGQGISC